MGKFSFSSIEGEIGKESFHFTIYLQVQAFLVYIFSGGWVFKRACKLYGSNVMKLDAYLVGKLSLALQKIPPYRRFIKPFLRRTKVREWTDFQLIYVNIRLASLNFVFQKLSCLLEKWFSLKQGNLSDCLSC